MANKNINAKFSNVGGNLKLQHNTGHSMDEKTGLGGAFWGDSAEDETNGSERVVPVSENPTLEQRGKSYGSSFTERSAELHMEKQRLLNEDWSEPPTDLVSIRDTIQGSIIVYLGCAGLYLLMTVPDGDASPISPLREQLWPLVVIAIVGSLHFLVSRQLREVRWYAEEMTVVIYRRGIFGAASNYVVSATKLEQGDRLILNSETHSWTDDDGSSRTSTNYWIEIHRNNVKIGAFANDWNNKLHLLNTIDFIEKKLNGSS